MKRLKSPLLNGINLSQKEKISIFKEKLNKNKGNDLSLLYHSYKPINTSSNANKVIYSKGIGTNSYVKDTFQDIIGANYPSSNKEVRYYN